MSKRIGYIIIFILIIFFTSTVTFASVDGSLDNFIKNNGIENMTEEEIREKLKSIVFDEDQQKTSCTQSVSQILGNIESLLEDEKQMERLQKEFEYQSSLAVDEQDPYYLYYGYALGLKKTQINKNKTEVGDISNKNDDELQKQFDEKLEEYNKLTQEEKERYETAKKYYDALMTINNKITDKQKKNSNLSKIDPVYDNVLNSEPTQGELDNNNGGTGAGASTGKLGNSSASVLHTPDEIITEANEFVKQATGSPLDGDKLKGASSTLYNLLLSIGIFLSVVIGVYLGVKFMVSTAEDKAKVKEALIPYIVGCIVVFSAFIVWKIIIELLGGIS